MDPDTIDFTLRCMAAKDVPHVTAIEKASLPNPWSALQLTEEIGLENRWVYVAETQDRVIAYLYALCGVDAWEILRIAAAKPFRRHGVASMLMDALLQAFDASPAERLLLEVRPSNTVAIAFYTAKGFHVSGRRPRYYRDGEDALLMALEKR